MDSLALTFTEEHASMPGPALCALYVWTLSVLTSPLWGRKYCAHFSDEETELHQVSEWNRSRTYLTPTLNPWSIPSNRCERNGRGAMGVQRRE